jgi:hypothetical protein
MKNFDERVVDQKSHRFKPLGLSSERLPGDAMATIPTRLGPFRTGAHGSQHHFRPRSRASRTALWNAGLTSRMAWLLRSGQVRFVNRTTAMFASKSIQREHPL